MLYLQVYVKSQFQYFPLRNFCLLNYPPLLRNYLSRGHFYEQKNIFKPLALKVVVVSSSEFKTFFPLFCFSNFYPPPPPPLPATLNDFCVFFPADLKRPTVTFKDLYSMEIPFTPCEKDMDYVLSIGNFYPPVNLRLCNSSQRRLRLRQSSKFQDPRFSGSYVLNEFVDEC